MSGIYLVQCNACGWEGDSTELDGVKPSWADSETDWVDACPDCLSNKLEKI